MLPVLNLRTALSIAMTLVVAGLFDRSLVQAEIVPTTPPGQRPAGEIVVWGTIEETVIPAGDDFVDVAVGHTQNGRFLIALRSDGSLYGYPEGIPETAVPPGNDFVSVHAGGGGLAVRGDGSLVTWGFPEDMSSPLGTELPWDESVVPEGTFVAISANQFSASSAGFVLSAVRSDGEVITWFANHGDDYSDWQFLGHECIDVSFGGGFWVAVRTDGTMVGGGSNAFGELDFPAGLNDVVAVRTSYSGSVVLRADGSLLLWGYPGWAVLPEGSDFIAIDQYFWNGVALRSDGSLAEWEGFGPTPAGPGFVAVAAGYWNAAIRSTNSPPVADAGGDQTVVAGPPGAIVLLDGSGSFDGDGDELEFEWSVAEDSGIVLDDPSSAVTAGLFPVGVHEVTLTVFDLDAQGVRQGSLSVSSVQIIVLDGAPPTAMITTDIAAIWPPNNNMKSVVISVFSSDSVDSPEELLLSCTAISSQPDGNPPSAGDVNGHNGYAAPVPVNLTYLGNGEWRAVIQLRAERDGGDHQGRIYSINLEVHDAAGNLATASTTVIVPHDQGKKK